MAATCRIAEFGRLPNGRAVSAVTLTSGALSATILDWGATLQALLAPDRNGTVADVTGGFATIDGYLAHSGYFGACIGRVANRIAGGRFVLDGREYQVPCNNGANALHGGPEGFDRRLWTIEAHGVESDGDIAFVRMSLVSPDGDQGFPGEINVLAEWRLGPAQRLSLTFVVTSNAPTIVNLTNHAYWNLAGEGEPSVLDHELTIPAAHFLPTDAGSIPTGERRPVADTPFDFQTAQAIGARIGDADDQLAAGRGYDHNWCLCDRQLAEPAPACRLHDSASGRTLEIWSDKAGLQFYSGNFLDGSFSGKSGRAYQHRSLVALEPQCFPDTPNQPAFGSIRLDPGETYRHAIEWRFSA